ncbi:uncharacterized protein LOC130901300 [Diorhabda carinulata]|uniref:uncharacterized protein LOC130901300 n=1 Tax=Diorhabda carinulata TaxID=1163345 RepID=UPI0025A09E36|nr:uncharacterized protein LOC130901300 [Diorhabda carinulata]
MRLCNIFVIFVTVTTFSNIAVSSNSWWRLGRMTGLLLNRCFWTNDQNLIENPEQIAIILKECFVRRGLIMLDNAIGKDVIELFDGVELIRYREKNTTIDSRELSISRKDDRIDWKLQYIDSLKKLFDTHFLSIQLQVFESSSAEEGRHRRRQNMFSQLLMFGLIAASFIVIPMGFQFLAILGGKALLLAKMALLLTSIQGLKKIATSNFNYGLYSYGNRGNPWHYDRQWPFEGSEGYQKPNIGEDYIDLLHPRNENLQK